MTEERSFRKAGPCLLLFLLPLLTAAQPSSAQDPDWYLLSRDDGYVELRLLVKALPLSRAPASPEDFARMMKDHEQFFLSSCP